MWKILFCFGSIIDLFRFVSDFSTISRYLVVLDPSSDFFEYFSIIWDPFGKAQKIPQSPISFLIIFVRRIDSIVLDCPEILWHRGSSYRMVNMHLLNAI